MSSEINSKSISTFGSRVYTGLVVIGALASLGLLVNEGRQTPLFLLIMYIGWVLSPFAGLLVGLRFLERRASSVRLILFLVMPIIVVGSIAAYAGLLAPPETRPAAIFLMVPLFSWVLMVIAISTTVLLARRRV